MHTYNMCALQKCVPKTHPKRFDELIALLKHSCRIESLAITTTVNKNYVVVTQQSVHRTSLVD